MVIIIILVVLLLLNLAYGCNTSNYIAYEGFDEEKTDCSGSDCSGSETDCSGSDCSGSETDCSGSDCSGKEGFNTLSYGDVNNMSTIDTISTVNGSMTCLSHSSNLTNSTGPLCLSREQIMSIKTRGGNASCPSI